MTAHFHWPFVSAQYFFLMIMTSGIINLAVWRGHLVQYSLNRLDESSTEANEEIPIDSVLDGGQEKCSVLLFLVTIHVASPFINCILFIHPGATTTEFGHTNNSRCPRNSKTRTDTLNFHRNLYKTLNCLKWNKTQMQQTFSSAVFMRASCWHVYP